MLGHTPRLPLGVVLFLILIKWQKKIFKIKTAFRSALIDSGFSLENVNHYYTDKI